MKVALMTSDRDSLDRQARIRDRAYAIWEREGRPDGKHLECLQRAERQIEDEDRAAAPEDQRHRPGAPADRRSGS